MEDVEKGYQSDETNTPTGGKVGIEDAVDSPIKSNYHCLACLTLTRSSKRTASVREELR